MSARIRLPLDWHAGRYARLGPRTSVTQRVIHRVRNWLPANREDRDAAYFAAGELWMGCVLFGVWLLVRYL